MKALLRQLSELDKEYASKSSMEGKMAEALAMIDAWKNQYAGANNDSDQLEALHKAREQLSTNPSAEDVFTFGLEWVGFDAGRQAKASYNLNYARFRANYGIGHKAIKALIDCLKEKKYKINLRGLMMTLSWYKHYLSEYVMEGYWGLSPKTVRDHLKRYTKMIQSLKPNKITFDGWGNDEIHIISVDGCNFRTQEFRLDPNSKWYDHKSHSSGVKYEFALAIRSNRLVWINGPFPAGGKHDLTVYRGGTKADGEKNWDKDALHAKMPPGKKAIGDSGYKGVSSVVTKSKAHSEGFSEFIARAKNRQETFNMRLNIFDILTKRFRHGVTTEDKLEQHKSVTEAICVLVQFDMENGHPLFTVE